MFLIKFAVNTSISLIKLTLGTSLVVSGVAIATKPKDETFEPFVKKFVDQEMNKHDSKSLFEFAIKQVMPTAVDCASTKYVEDCILFKIGTVKLGSEQVKFIGAFNGWYHPR